MTAYVDLGFLLVLVVKSTQTNHAWDLLHRFEAPIHLNGLHRLQVENAITRQLHESKTSFQAAARQALREWRNKVAEAVFDFAAPDWETAFRQATLWNQQYPGQPPHHTFLLHAALAAVQGSTHFLSFQPETRTLAKGAGLKLLPERL